MRLSLFAMRTAMGEPIVFPCRNPPRNSATSVSIRCRAPRP
jgi:hypothetical protein